MLRSCHLDIEILVAGGTETRRHIDWLKKKNLRYTACLTLHEDCDAEGYYLYELNPDKMPSLVPIILSATGKICGVDRSATLDGYPSKDGVIHLSTDLPTRPYWTETAYLLAHHTRLAYTLEAPGNQNLDVQVAAHVCAVEAAVGQLIRNS